MVYGAGRGLHEKSILTTAWVYMFCCPFSVFILGRCAGNDRKGVLENTTALAVWETKRRDLVHEQLLTVPSTHPELGAPYRRPYP